MKLKNLILAYLLLPILAHAQSNFHEGYVVKAAGDTLKGYIDYREWQRSPLTVSFKANLLSRQTQLFDPQAVQSFAINGMDTYISYHGRISMNKNQFPGLGFAPDTTTRGADVFLRIITQGPNVKLLRHADELKTRFFIQETGTTALQELIYQQYYKDELAQQVLTSDIYKGQLKLLLNKFGVLTPANIRLAETANYEQESLEKIIQIINHQTNKKEHGKKAASTRFLAGIGVTNAQGSFYHPYSFDHVKSASSYQPWIGVGFDVFVNPNVQRFIFRAEAAYSGSNNKFTRTILNSNYTETYTLEQRNFSISPQVIYNIYNKDNLKFYLGIGPSLNISSYPKNQLRSDYLDADNVTDNPYSPLKLWFSIPTHAGMVVNKRFELFLTYVYPMPISGNNNIDIKIREFRSGLRYLFTQKAH